MVPSMSTLQSGATPSPCAPVVTYSHTGGRSEQTEKKGKRQISAMLPIALVRRLAVASVNERRTQSAIIADALERYFKETERGK